MYATGPATRGGPASGGPLRISAVARRAFDGPAGIAAAPGHHDHLHNYLSDLVRPYRLALADDLAAEEAGHSYGEMASVLIDELVADQQPVDLVVLAFAIPDVRPGRATATYLSELCPGSPLAFAICDQGAAAAFTGLRLVREYARTGGCRRALLLVVEQAALPYDAGLPVAIPTGHAAVGLRCEDAGPAEVGAVYQYADVAPQPAAALLAEALVAAGTDDREVCLIADRQLVDDLPRVPGRVRVAAAGTPHTGGWWELAALTARRAETRALLASYDRQLRYLCLATIDVAGDL
jgi:4-hydroxymandelate oxidase